MDKDDRQEEAITRGHTASAFLNNLEFIAAVESIREKNIGIIISSGRPQKEEREDAYINIKVLDDLVAEIKSVADGAKVVGFNRSLRGVNNGS